jgi:hypothetical protein
MTADQTLIEQVLATLAARGPAKLGEPLDLPWPGQSLIYGVYAAAQAQHRGYGRENEVSRHVQLARQAGISEDEIEAAIAAGERQD